VKRVVLRGLGARCVGGCFENGARGPKGGIGAVHVSGSSDDGKHELGGCGECVRDKSLVESYSRVWGK